MFTSAYLNLKAIFPESHFYLLSYYPKADRKVADVDDVTILPGTPLQLLFVILPLSALYWCFSKLGIQPSAISGNRTLRALETADLVLDIGGITFADGREIYLPFNIVTLLPALIMRKRVIKLAQAIGPFNGRINRLCAGLILFRMARIYARGEATMDYLKHLGIKNAVSAPDLAFSMPAAKIDSVKVHRYRFENNLKTIGISPSSVVFKYCSKNRIDYVEIMARFCDDLMRRWQYNVIMIPHSIRMNTKKLKNNDLPVIQKIVRAMASVEKPVVVDEELSSHELRTVTKTCDCFFASRFHSMVSALSVEVPVMVCAWGHKYSEVLHQFGLETYAIDYHHLSLELLQRKFQQLILNEADVRSKIRSRLPVVIDDSKQYARDIREYLDQAP